MSHSVILQTGFSFISKDMLPLKIPNKQIELETGVTTQCSTFTRDVLTGAGKRGAGADVVHLHGLVMATTESRYLEFPTPSGHLSCQLLRMLVTRDLLQTYSPSWSSVIGHIPGGDTSRSKAR